MQPQYQHQGQIPEKALMHRAFETKEIACPFVRLNLNVPGKESAYRSHVPENKWQGCDLGLHFHWK